MSRPKRSLGQNFLVDRGFQARIVAALEPTEHDDVLEIGPGRGALTHHLAGQVRRLRVVELDDELAESLRAELADVPGVDVIHANILHLDPEGLTDPASPLKVVGNIPYNITTPLIFWLLDLRPPPAMVVLMVQREVADRILADPGQKAYGALTVGVRAAAAVERLFHVSRGAFRPVPDVDSTVLRLVPHSPPLLGDDEAEDLRTLTRTAFGWRRKQLQKILRAAPEYGLSPDELERVTLTTGMEPEQRPETLSPREFIALARALRRLGYPRSEKEAS